MQPVVMVIALACVCLSVASREPHSYTTAAPNDDRTTDHQSVRILRSKQTSAQLAASVVIVQSHHTSRAQEDHQGGTLLLSIYVGPAQPSACYYSSSICLQCHSVANTPLSCCREHVFGLCSSQSYHMQSSQLLSYHLPHQFAIVILLIEFYCCGGHRQRQPTSKCQTRTTL